MEELISVDTYTIKDKNYIVVKEMDYKNNHYLYLSNIDDDSDLMIRKLNGNILEPLESDIELMDVLKEIIK